MKEILRNAPRTTLFTPHINPYAAGSVLAQFGNTKVHITAFVEEELPPWMRGEKRGWVTAEYAMLPGSTHTRGRRERKGISGRSQEIQRLIGRSLRSVVDLKKMGPRTLNVDCDVIVADGGTRTTAISGGYVAMALAFQKLKNDGLLSQLPLKEALGAISVGITKEGKIIADLNYEEDSTCETDMNIVMTRSGRFVEIQGTAEGEEPFERADFDSMLSCAENALRSVFAAQEKAIAQ